MGLYYKSTRNSNLKVTASEAILKGLAPDGGLFVPSELPKLDVTMSDLKGKTYQEIAYLVMKQFLTDFTEEELKNCIDKAYDSKFDTEEIAPLVKVERKRMPTILNFSMVQQSHSKIWHYQSCRI